MIGQMLTIGCLVILDEYIQEDIKLLICPLDHSMKVFIQNAPPLYLLIVYELLSNRFRCLCAAGMVPAEPKPGQC